MKFGLRSPVCRIEYLALEKIYASDSRVFATKSIRFVWNMPSISGDSKTKGLPHWFYGCLFFNRLLLLVVSISQSVTLKKYFMIANIYNFLRAFHTFLCEIEGHVCRHSVVKQRACCRLVNGNYKNTVFSYEKT